MLKKIPLLTLLLCSPIIILAQSDLPERKIELNYTLQSRSGLTINWNSVHDVDHKEWMDLSQYRFKTDYGTNVGSGRLSVFLEATGTQNDWNSKRNFGLVYGFHSGNSSIELQFFQRTRSNPFSKENGTDFKVNWTTKF